MRVPRQSTAHPLLQSLKATELKHLASLIGLNNSGTRISLLGTLEKELPRPRIPASHHSAATTRTPLRILSIDMGIRNLAYCVLELSQQTTSTGPPGRGKFAEGPAAFDLSSVSAATHQARVLDSLKLVAWRRTAVSSATPADSGVVNSGHADVDVVSSRVKEAFDPATFAKLAYSLVTDVLLPHRVSHILIERQRWRSGGAPAVLEWTVRVNIFESMLHAVIETLARQWVLLQDQDPLGFNLEGKAGNVLHSLPFFPTVQSVSPKKVGTFWIDAVGGAGSRSESKSRVDAEAGIAQPLASRRSKIEKEAKIAIAEGWLRAGLECGGDADETRNAFLLKRERGRAKDGTVMKVAKTDGEKRRKKQKSLVNGECTANAQLTEDDDSADTLPTGKMGKLDDLADCLLQGVAFVQWESNRRQITELVQMEHDIDDQKKSS